jgi:hypothetical protein
VAAIIILVISTVLLEETLVDWQVLVVVVAAMLAMTVKDLAALALAAI